MALRTTRHDKIPFDAVVLTESEAVQYQRNRIAQYPNKKDIWFLNYGSAILGCTSAASGAYIQNYYRYKLRLQNFGRLSTYLPVVVIPSVLGMVLHFEEINGKIIIQKYSCPLCIELRSAVYQAMSGCVYPSLLAPAGAFMMATRYHTYNMPYMSNDPKGVWKLYVKLTKPIYIPLLSLLFGHMLLAMFVTYKENQAVLQMEASLREEETDDH